VELDDVVEEGLGDGERCVRVAQGNEVRHLGEPVDDGEDHRLAADLRKSLDEVHGNVTPDGLRDVQRLKKTGRVQVLCFVALAHPAAAHELAHHPGGLWIVGGAQADERLLCSLMARAMRRLEQLRPEGA
jgi:hypothetical protein